MQIGQQQFDILLQQDMPAYVDRILQSVRSQYPTLRQSDDMLRDSIRTGIKRARAHELVSDQDVMAYVLTMFACAPNFDQQALIAKTLSDRSRPAQERWEALFSEEFDDAWHEANQVSFYDERFWVDPDTLAARASAARAADPNEDDWADLVMALRQAQAPAPYPATTEADRADARTALADALARNKSKQPADWEAEARALAYRGQAPKAAAKT